MGENHLIRDETPEDYAKIHSIHGAAFPTKGEADLVDRLRADGDLTISLVAILGGDIVGHIAFSPVVLASGKNMSGLGLAPVAVVDSQRRRGLAASLVEEGLKRAKTLGYACVVVLGNPDYYGRFGFTPASTWALQDIYGGGDAFQALELEIGGISGGGIVHYARAFDHLE